MIEVARQLFAERANLATAGTVALLYLVLYQASLGDLVVDLAGRPLAWTAAAGWQPLLFRERAPFQFEPVAVLEAPGLVWLLSPVNLVVGAALGLLAGVQIALVRIARRCSQACGLGPFSGVLVGLPGLLAGGACCAPLLFLLLGVQITTSLVTLVGLLVPAAFLLLAIGLFLTLRTAARRCGAAGLAFLGPGQ